MFKGEAPIFKDKSMQSYFNLCKRKMDLSKQRKSSGTAGGSVRKKSQVKAEQKAVHAEEPNITMDYDEFRREYPDIQGDLFGSAERYKTALDWAEVAARMETDIDLQNETNIYRLTQKYIQRYGERR